VVHVETIQVARTNTLIPIDKNQQNMIEQPTLIVLTIAVICYFQLGMCYTPQQPGRPRTD